MGMTHLKKSHNGNQPIVSLSVKGCRNKSTTQLQLQYL